MGNKVQYLFEEDHIVAKKNIGAKHFVTLYYYPKKEDKDEEWQVEVDVGGFFQETYHRNEISARWSYDLIDETFIACLIKWHKMRKDSDDYYSKIHEIHSRNVFNGRGNQMDRYV